MQPPDLHAWSSPQPSSKAFAPICPACLKVSLWPGIALTASSHLLGFLCRPQSCWPWLAINCPLQQKTKSLSLTAAFVGCGREPDGLEHLLNFTPLLSRSEETRRTLGGFHNGAGAEPGARHWRSQGAGNTAGRRGEGEQPAPWAKSVWSITSCCRLRKVLWVSWFHWRAVCFYISNPSFLGRE